MTAGRVAVVDVRRVERCAHVFDAVKNTSPRDDRKHVAA
jgi:hypothetical protein